MKERKRVRAYISGKITGEPRAKELFQRAEVILYVFGFEPVNPLNNGLPSTATWEEHMKADLEKLKTCQMIFLLPNWTDSKGAQIEEQVARSIGIKVCEINPSLYYDI